MSKYKKTDIGFNGRHFTFGPGIFKELKADFWDKDVESELTKAERWLLANPPKKDYRRFAINWLNNCKRSLNFTERKKLDERPQDLTTPRTMRNDG